MTQRWRAAMLLAALVGGWQLVAAALPQADAPLDERVATMVGVSASPQTSGASPTSVQNPQPQERKDGNETEEGQVAAAHGMTK